MPAAGTGARPMVRIDDTSTPVVILRAVAHGPLGTLRSLGRLGVPVYVVDHDPRTPAFASRYCRGKFVFDIEKIPEAQAVGSLVEVGRKVGGRPILIPTTDEATLFVADHADLLREWFRFPEPGAQLVHALCSKRRMYLLAKQFGVPTAETVFPHSRQDVLQFLEKATFPVMLKGIDGLKLFERAGKRMFVVHTERDLLEKYDAWEDPQSPNLMFQEYIPGGDDTVWMFNGYFNDASECVVGYTGKKIRQCPVYRGVTSLGICLKNEVVDRTTREFMKAIGYKGILDIGYRFDARDGSYKVLDVNPRIGGTFRLFVADNGMDVARAAYLALTRQSIEPGNLIEGRKWIVEDLDFASCLRYAHDGKLAFRQWITSFRGIQEAAYFASDDLAPLGRMFLNNAKEVSRRAYRYARGQSLSPSQAPRGVAKA